MPTNVRSPPNFIGTFMLISSVLGAAFYAFAAPMEAAGILGVALSTGATVMALSFAIGHVCHPRPRRRRARQRQQRGRLYHRPAHRRGGLWLFCHDRPRAARLRRQRLCCTVDAALSICTVDLHAGLISVFLIATLPSAFVVFIIMGATSRRAPAGFAPIAIGLTLTAVQIIANPPVQRLGQPRAQLGQRRVRRRHGTPPAVGVPGGADPWRRIGGSIARWLRQELGA